MKEVLQIKSSKKLTKQQESFNKLVKHIEKRTQELAYLEEGFKKYQVSKQEILEGILKEKANTKLQYALMLDEIFEKKKFTKKEKEKLAQIIMNITCRGYAKEEELDNKLTEIYDKYSNMQFSKMSAEEMKMGKEMMQMMMREMMGVDIDLSDMDGLSMKGMKEKVMEHMKEKMSQGKTDEDHEANYQRKNKHASGLSDKAKEAAQKLNKSWKQIYLSLVKTLHPDTEADEKLKLEKEAVLKEVTTAYDENNFFKLLQLQLKYTSNADLLERADDKTLHQYVAILKQQSSDLAMKLEEVKEVIHANNAEFIIQKDGSSLIKLKLMKEKRLTEIEIETLKNEMKAYSDVAFLKQEMKKINLQQLQGNGNMGDMFL